MISKKDQVKVILKDLGIQTDHDLSFITSEHAIQYVRELEQSHVKYSNEHGHEPNLRERCGDMKLGISAKNQEIVEIMLNFLSFNPFFRMTAFECLTQCKIFDSVRSRKKEAYLKRMMGMSKEELEQAKIDYRYKQGSNQQSKRAQEISQLKEQKGGTSLIDEKGYVGFPTFPIIELPIDSIDSFDYENAENAKYSVDDLRGILIEEIKIYRDRRQRSRGMERGRSLNHTQPIVSTESKSP